MDISLQNAEEPSDEVRCLKCGKLLAKHDLMQNILEVKCLRCGTLNALFREVKDQVIVTDPEGIILYANSLVETITGYTLAEILGKKPSLWGGQMPPEFYKRMWHEIKTNKTSFVTEVCNKKKDGTLYKAILRISPVLSTDGEVKMYVGMESVVK